MPSLFWPSLFILMDFPELSHSFLPSSCRGLFREAGVSGLPLAQSPVALNLSSRVVCFSLSLFCKEVTVISSFTRPKCQFRLACLPLLWHCGPVSQLEDPCMGLALAASRGPSRRPCFLSGSPALTVSGLWAHLPRENSPFQSSHPSTVLFPCLL